MYRPETSIRIGSYRFSSVESVSYERDVDVLGATAVIKLPTAFRVRGGNTEKYTEEAVKPGDRVSIVFYDDLHDFRREEFVGFVTRVLPKTPVEIHCEDAVWLLRQKSITKAFNDGCTLADLLNDVLEGVGIGIVGEVPKVELGKYIMKDANAAQILQRLKTDYGLHMYITEENMLFVGLKYDYDAGEVTYSLDSGLVRNDLEYRTAQQRKIKVKYEYIAPDNQRTVVEVGDSDGDTRTYHTTQVADPAKLKEMAESQLTKLQYDGYDGSITSFMLPYAAPGMAAKITSDRYPDREGRYFVSKTECELGMGGARRKITLGIKL